MNKRSKKEKKAWRYKNKRMNEISQLRAEKFLWLRLNYFKLHSKSHLWVVVSSLMDYVINTKRILRNKNSLNPLLSFMAHQTTSKTQEDGPKVESNFSVYKVNGSNFKQYGLKLFKSMTVNFSKLDAISSILLTFCCHE